MDVYIYLGNYTLVTTARMLLPVGGTQSTLKLLWCPLENSGLVINIYPVTSNTGCGLWIQH